MKSVSRPPLLAETEVREGVPQDYAEAVKWFRMAAEQGTAAAQSSLGLAYVNGRGALQDFVQAHMWFNLAAAKGEEKGREYRDSIAMLMTSADILEAQRLAREWLEEHAQ